APARAALELALDHGVSSRRHCSRPRPARQATKAARLVALAADALGPADRQAARAQIGLDLGAPQVLAAGQQVAAGAESGIDLDELALAAGGAERGKIRPAVAERVERVVLAVDPQGRRGVARRSSEQRLVDRGRAIAARAQPAADEIDDAAQLLCVAGGISDAQDAAARGAGPD